MDPTEVLGKAGGKIDRGEPGGRRTAAEGRLAASCSIQATGRRGEATCLQSRAFQPFGQPLCQAGPPAEPGRKTEPTQSSEAGSQPARAKSSAAGRFRQAAHVF